MPFKLLLVVIIFLIPVMPTFWAILDIPKRRFAEPKKKLLWLAVVSTLPCVGAICYILVGRRQTTPLEAA